jgi:hypothetical protein
VDDGDDDREPHDGAPRAERRSLRPSRPPHVPHPLLGLARGAFALAWIALQLTLVLTADRRPDGAFGFRIFGESTTVRVVLYRELAGAGGRPERVRVEGGAWDARDASGVVRHSSWFDRVRLPELVVFDREVWAPAGASAELVRLQAALDDVARHTPDDAETLRLVLDVTTRQNGRDPQVHRLVSARRPAGGS